MSKKTTFTSKEIRQAFSAANKEFFAEIFNISKVCKYWSEESNERPLRDAALLTAAKYLTPNQITPKFLVENSSQTVNGEIKDRKRFETPESILARKVLKEVETPESILAREKDPKLTPVMHIIESINLDIKAKYHFKLTDTRKEKFSPAFVSGCILNFCGKQFALISSQTVKNPPIDKNIVNEDTTLLDEQAKKVIEESKIIARNKRNNKAAAANKAA